MRIDMVTALRGSLLVLVGAGCCGSKQPPLSADYQFTRDHNFVGQKPLTKQILLLADNQTQHLHGDPFWMRSPLPEVAVHTAIRPVQLDMYGQDLLKWVLQYDQDPQGLHAPILHLGDGLNMSCSSEMDAFFENMRDAKDDWLMAPGNHDGLFFGNVASSGSWQVACAGSTPVHRDQFLARYLTELAGRKGAATIPKPGNDGEWHAPEGTNGLLHAATWHIDHSEHWKSFVIQAADFTLPGGGVQAFSILLDTNQYEKAPELLPVIHPNAGLTGDIGPEQLEAARRMLQPHRNEKLLVVLMGHHPYEALTERGKRVIDALRHEYPVALYVSAHTHEAQYLVNRDDQTKEAWLELNLGSVLDWPPEFRTMAFVPSSDGKRMAVTTPQVRLDRLWTVGANELTPTRPATWEPGPGEPRYYLTYMGLPFTTTATETAEALLKTQLAEYAEVITRYHTETAAYWPPGAKTDADVLQLISDTNGKSWTILRAMAMAVQRFEDQRVVAPAQAKEHRAYRLYQALSASERMSVRTRVPDAQDSYVEFPSVKK